MSQKPNSRQLTQFVRLVLTPNGALCCWQWAQLERDCTLRVGECQRVPSKVDVCA